MNFKEASKNWSWTASDRPNIEQINAGSLQRIADSTEEMAESSKAMAKNHVQMEHDLAWYKSETKRLQEKSLHLERSRAAHQAHTTRLRNQLAAAKLDLPKQQAISQFTGFHYGPEYGVIGLAESMGLTKDEYFSIADDLNFLSTTDLSELEDHFTDEEAA